MARLFGIISPEPVDLTVTFSLEHAPVHKSHGLGIGWYDRAGKQHIQKQKRSTLTPIPTQIQPQSVEASIAIVHTRVASSGIISDQNTHPFSYKNWIFAHSGTVHKEELMQLLKPPFNQNFQSEPIDSEVYFRFIIQSIEEQGEKEGFRSALKQARDSRGATFLLSDGTRLIAYRYGLPLYYIRWKIPSPLHVVTRETALIYQSKKIATQQAFIVSSEILTRDNWTVFDDRELLIIYKNLQFESVRIANGK